MTTILLIEDNLDTARMVRKLLTPLGYNVPHAATGFSGIQMARETKPDLILVDINLPDLDGKVVAMQLRSVLKGMATHIVAFTADPCTVAKRFASVFGFDGFLNKPIDPRAFPTQIGEFLNCSHTNIDSIQETSHNDNQARLIH